MAIVSEKGRTPSSLGVKLVFVRSDLDVHQGRFFGLQVGKGRFQRGSLGVVDGLKILVDRHRWRLGVLIDDELYSGLRHFNRRWVMTMG